MESINHPSTIQIKVNPGGIFCSETQGHLANLLKICEIKGYVLDIGCGTGKFLSECRNSKIEAVGIDTCDEYLDECRNKELSVIKGRGEDLPFTDNEFDFVNCTGVVEHCDNPEILLRECFRVLRNGGEMYVDVPSRFSFIDPHYKMMLVNWMPRKLAKKYAGERIDQEDKGKQQIDEMHYYTYGGFVKLVNSVGFKYKDSRKHRVPKLLRFIYYLIRPFYFQSFHFLLNKGFNN